MRSSDSRNKEPSGWQMAPSEFRCRWQILKLISGTATFLSEKVPLATGGFECVVVDQRTCQIAHKDIGVSGSLAGNPHRGIYSLA
jgi:hypothetical protein